MLGFNALSAAPLSALANQFIEESAFENITLTDAVVEQLAVIAAGAEVLILSDVTDGIISLLSSASDAINLSEIEALGFLLQASDALLLIDGATNIAGMVAAASDTFTLVDVGVGYGGWDPIPNPNQGWTPVGPGATNPWTPIPPAATTWTPIGNS
jgi:hypothetical protein